MTDVHSKKVRRYNMSRIKGKDTKPEILVRKFLFANGIRFRLHDKRFPGKPDLVFPKYGVVLFIHGCFWHGHKDCKYYVIPKTRTEWWLNKINGNIRKDIENVKLLKNENWKVLTVWECDLKTGKQEKTLQRLLKQFKN